MDDDVHSSNEDEASVEASVHDSIQADGPSIGLVETVSVDDDDKPSVVIDDLQGQPERPKDNRQDNIPVPAAMQRLQDNLNGSH